MVLYWYMNKLPILFSCLGFSSCEVYILKDGRQLNIGILWDSLSRSGHEYEFDLSEYCIDGYVNRHNYLNLEDIPSSKEIVQEYKRQFLIKGVCINPDNIIYAG